MDAERALLSKIVRERDMSALTENSITETFFLDAEHLKVLRWMTKHYTEHASSPSEQAVHANFPTWELADTPEPMSFYVEQIRTRYKYDVLAESVAASAAAIEDGDLADAEAILLAGLADVAGTVAPLRDHNMTDPDAFNDLFDWYAWLTRNPGELRGYSTGFPTIDLATMGLQDQQLVTLVGPPKAGKSTVALAIANAVQQAGNDVLMISFEMSYDEMMSRWVGLRAKLNYRRLLKGKMNEFDERRMERVLKKLQAGEANLIMSEDASSTTTVSGVIAKLQLHKPKLLVIDGVYMMDDENGEPKGSSAAITNITRSLKRAAQLFRIPILITTQTLFSKMRGQSISASSIGYSSSFGQDSDTVIAVEPREDPEGGADEHWIKVLLSRSGPKAEVQIEFDWSTSTFTEYADSQSAEDDHDEEDDGEDFPAHERAAIKAREKAKKAPPPVDDQPPAPRKWRSRSRELTSA